MKELLLKRILTQRKSSCWDYKLNLIKEFKQSKKLRKNRMNIKRIVILGMTSLSLLGISTTSLMQVKTQVVKAVHYKYADKYYKVKLLRKTEVDKAPHPYIKLSDVYYHWKYLPAGSIVYVKSNGSNVSWTVKGAQLPGKYWVTDYNSQDYSWFSTNLNAELPRNTYNAHGFVVRQTPNTISLTTRGAS